MTRDDLPLEAREHLLSVRPDARRHMLQTFAEAPWAKGHAQVLNAPAGKGARILHALNQRGHGIYFAPSDFGDSGRRWIADVERAFHLWLDLDGATPPEHYPLTPHAEWTTSPGRHQAIWRVDELPQDNTTHRRLLTALARRYAADEKATGTNRVLRLAGYLHQKRDPHLVRLDSVSDHRTYQLGEVLEAWPELDAAMREPAPEPAAPLKIKPGSDRLGKYVAQALQGEHDNVADAQEGSRNATLHVAAVRLGSLVGAGVLTELDARDALLAGVQAMTRPIDSHEAERTITSGIRYGKANPRQLEHGAA